MLESTSWSDTEIPMHVNHRISQVNAYNIIYSKKVYYLHALEINYNEFI